MWYPIWCPKKFVLIDRIYHEWSSKFATCDFVILLETICRKFISKTHLGVRKYYLSKCYCTLCFKIRQLWYCVSYGLMLDQNLVSYNKMLTQSLVTYNSMFVFSILWLTQCNVSNIIDDLKSSVNNSLKYHNT